MPGRKKPETTEQERDMEYVRHNKREGGTKIQGEKGDFLNYSGAAGQVRGEREQWMGAPKWSVSPPETDQGALETAEIDEEDADRQVLHEKE